MDETQKLNYASNSHKAREDGGKPQERKVEQVVSGDVKVKKKGFLSRIKSSLISDDSKSVKSYVLNDVFIPAAKKLISDVVTSGIDILLYGESRRSSKFNSGSKISYTKYYDSRPEPRYASRQTDYAYNDVVFQTRVDAERVLDVLEEAISEYGLVSVADFYDAAGISSQYTDNNYGWTNLSSAKIMPTRDGWTIVLPRAMSLK